MTAQRSAQPTRRAGAGRATRVATTSMEQDTAPGRAAELVAGWGPTIGRLLLGVVLAWFGYHELVQPGQWTGYVPGVHSASSFAYRLAAGLAALLLLQIVVWLAISAGLSDLTLRDVGVLGLACCLMGSSEQRLLLTS